MNLRPMPERASCPTGLRERLAQQNQTVLEGKMNRKSLNHNMDREEKDATKSRPSPADFPLAVGRLSTIMLASQRRTTVESSTDPEHKQEVLIYLVECPEHVPGLRMFMEEDIWVAGGV